VGMRLNVYAHNALAGVLCALLEQESTEQSSKTEHSSWFRLVCSPLLSLSLLV
jgi:hypothetical protein